MKLFTALSLIPPFVIGLTALLLFSESEPVLQSRADARTASKLESSPVEAEPSSTACLARIALPRDEPESVDFTIAIDSAAPDDSRGAVPETSPPVDWSLTSRKIALRLGTLDDRFQGAAYEIGKFVEDHALDVDSLDQDQLSRLSDRYAQLWSQRLEALSNSGVQQPMELLADPERTPRKSHSRWIEEVESLYREREAQLASDFR
jgi:hypothetical protein